ncbi:zinc-dependent alcohol dehydrogenase [Salisaeta longa]|uniref:zinc-dependent alcohol dehydrogenase n=1 Tax=Salisaeta longa TaxID=503170 RepID=UPI001B7F9CB2|nr:zinc-binding alcohol dehydrogenase [Salisaeta longa]
MAPREVEVRTEPLPPPEDEAVQVSVQRSAISAGTERLVYEGAVASDTTADTTLDALAEDMSYPFLYGYATVGRVIACGAAVDDAQWRGRRVFAFQPHASHYNAAPDTLIPMPDAIADETALYLPNLETATSLVMDAAPRIGERIAVFGAGIVGLLTTHLLADFPLAGLVAVEPSASRRHMAQALGADAAVAPGDTPEETADRVAAALGAEADGAIEVSGQPAVFSQAVRSVGYGGRVIVGSWYGTKRAPLQLDTHFHRNSVKIVSSQVSTIAPVLRGRWTKARRLDFVKKQLRQASFADIFYTRTVPIDQASNVFDEYMYDSKYIQLFLSY